MFGLLPNTSATSSVVHPCSRSAIAQVCRNDAHEHATHRNANQRRQREKHRLAALLRVQIDPRHVCGSARAGPGGSLAALLAPVGGAVGGISAPVIGGLLASAFGPEAIPLGIAGARCSLPCSVPPGAATGAADGYVAGKAKQYLFPSESDSSDGTASNVASHARELAVNLSMACHLASVAAHLRGNNCSDGRTSRSDPRDGSVIQHITFGISRCKVKFAGEFWTARTILGRRDSLSDE